MSQIRLQKYLAASGVCSRRKAEQYILDGRVAIKGETITTLGTKVDENATGVTVDGKEIHLEEEKVYYLLHKPKGYVTTLSDPQGRPVVTELLHGVKERVFPVGRLDFDTEGALLLTNDGELSQKILHPSFETFKTYEAHIVGVPSRTQLAELERGVLVDDKATAPAKVGNIFKRGSNSLVTITIHEGRKHQVKKMFAAIGHPVMYLKRLSYGQLGLHKIGKGQFRKISPSEIELIFTKKR